MKVRLPRFDQHSFLNDLIPTFAAPMWTKKSSKKAKFQFVISEIFANFPLKGSKSEDQVVESLLDFFNAIGWKTQDKRSTFVPGTKLKPDIWLNGGMVYVEALSLPDTFDHRNWIDHCARAVEHSKHSASRIAICTDGRRWFVVCTEDGELKFSFIDLKKFDRKSSESAVLASLLWKSGPLYEIGLKRELKEFAQLNKNIFKKHIMSTMSKVPDEYREYFGLISACAYAHYTKIASETIDTKAIHDCVYALKHEHFDAAIEILKKYIGKLALQDLAGLSSLAKRVVKLVGKKPEIDINIISALLIDHLERPLSWDTFNSDDLSEVYEELCKPRRKKHGIYATPRDVCYHVVQRQFELISDKALKKSLLMVDPCCGSGSFLDQAVRVLGEQFPSGGRRKNRPTDVTFLGQDVEDVAVAISMVNVAVACARYLWHLSDIEIDLSLSCGDSTDMRSPLFKRCMSDSKAFKIVFGNPPYLRSNSQRFGSIKGKGNLLFHVTEKVMNLCRPGELAFVLPAHIKGGDASLEFDEVSKKHGMRISEFWHLPEIKFRACSETRHVVVFWDNDIRSDAKILVLTPPTKQQKAEAFALIKQSRESSALKFKIENTTLDQIPLYANQHVPKDIGEAFSKLTTLNELRKECILTVAQGVQIVYPRVPRPSKKGEDKSRVNDVLAREGYSLDSSIFCLNENEKGQLKSSVRQNLTDLEKSHLIRFVEHSPNNGGIRLRKSNEYIIFTDKEMATLSEERFENEAPHFCAWLKPYKPLLMLSDDRRMGRLKWWEIHRSRSPKPNAKTKAGIEFQRPKVLVSRMLSRDIWSWYDEYGQIPGGTTFCAISPWPSTDIEAIFRDNAFEILSAWLNSYLIRQIWIKLLNNFKLRGADGEVQLKNLLNLPLPDVLLFESNDLRLEALVARLSKISRRLRASTQNEYLVQLDKICWQILERASGHDLGRPVTRQNSERVDLVSKA